MQSKQGGNAILLILFTISCGSGATLSAPITPAPKTETEKSLVLVDQGQSEYSIALRFDATEPMRHGATEIQTHLKQISGAELDIVTLEQGDPLPDHAIIILAATDSQPQQTGPPKETFSLRTEGSSVVIRGDDKRGALYGCYAFLENVLGVRWYNQRVTKIPKLESIMIDELDIHETPSFEYREPFWYEAWDRDWAVRNRTNSNRADLDDSVGGRIKFGKFAHTFNQLVPPAKYFDEHPEYFSEVDGKRMKGYYQLCLTNEDVLKISIDQVLKWIEADPVSTIFSVSQNDTYYRCQCPKCRAAEEEEGGAPSGPLLHFVNGVAEAIADRHPHVLIETLAYQYTEKPPKHVRPLPNVRIRLAPLGACFAHGLNRCDKNKEPFSNLKEWSKITDQLYVWHYQTNFTHYPMPLPNLDEIGADIPLFKKHGVVGLFYQGAYAKGGGGWMGELKAFLNAKLMWDTDLDAQGIIDDYLDGVYGPAAPQIRQWLDVLHDKLRNENVHMSVYDSPDVPYLTSEILDRGIQLFDEAKAAAAGNPTAADEVERARVGLEYALLMKISPSYAVIADKFVPQNADAWNRQAMIVSDLLVKYGVGQVREGESIDLWLERMKAPIPTHEVVTLENKKLRVDLVPGLGGRVVRMVDKPSGRNLLRENEAHKSLGFVNGGLTLTSSGGWYEPYEAKKKKRSQVTLVGTAKNGLRVERTVRLRGDTLRIDEEVTNPTKETRRARIRARCQLMASQGAIAGVRFLSRAGRDTELRFEGEASRKKYSGEDLPKDKLVVDLGDVEIVQSFGAAQVIAVAASGDPKWGHLTSDLDGTRIKLAPGKRTKLSTSFKVTHPKIK